MDDRFTSGVVEIEANHVRLLRDGAEAYPAMLSAIAAARVEVLLEIYWIGRDAIGERFREALVERARAGVRVLVTYDAIGSLGIGPEWWAPLVGAGGDVREFAPVFPLRTGFRSAHVALCDHRKILVADGEVGFTGGINIAEPWLPTDARQPAWRDDAIEVRGPAAADLRAVFYGGWRGLGGEPPKGESPASVRSAGARVCVIENRIGRRPDRAIRRAYLLAVRRSRRSVDIAAAYFLPGPRMLHALRRAAERGVRVRVLIPQRSDVRVVDLATSSIMGRLLGSGVRVFAYEARTLHAKTAVVDEIFVTIGSHNLDELSLRLNRECNVAIADPAFARIVEASFERDLEDARELDLASWKERPYWLRAAGWFAALLRSML